MSAEYILLYGMHLGGNALWSEKGRAEPYEPGASEPAATENVFHSRSKADAVQTGSFP